jgi:NAD-dependent DNA ligase
MKYDLSVLEQLILSHRYLYYVKTKPVISDIIYDKLEAAGCDLLADSSKVFDVGSDLEEDYTDEVKCLSMKLLGNDPNAMLLHTNVFRQYVGR